MAVRNFSVTGRIHILTAVTCPVDSITLEGKEKRWKSHIALALLLRSNLGQRTLSPVIGFTLSLLVRLE
jgi:aspartate aminotransferase-like enzyme